MRVIAGTARSMPLCTPKGDDIRPTTDRIKETLFNMLQTEVPGAIFCDFFAGSGQMGIEALSRGSRHAYFVESNARAIDCIKKNLDFTGLADRATVIGADVRKGLFEIQGAADIIFMDPPYGLDIESEIMKLLRESDVIKGESIIIIEADIGKDLRGVQALGYEIYKEKCYKTNKHIFLRK